MGEATKTLLALSGFIGAILFGVFYFSLSADDKVKRKEVLICSNHWAEVRMLYEAEKYERCGVYYSQFKNICFCRIPKGEDNES